MCNEKSRDLDVGVKFKCFLNRKYKFEIYQPKFKVTGMVQAHWGENYTNKGSERFEHYSAQPFESKATHDVGKESASKRREIAKRTVRQ